MKKKILSAVCALVVTLAVPMTAFAGASPSITYEASGQIGESAAYDQRVLSPTDDSLTYHYVKPAFIDEVRKQVYKLYKSCDASLADEVTIFDISKGDFTKDGNYTVKMEGVTASDSILVLLYDESTKQWSQTRAFTAEDGTVTFKSATNYSYFVFINDGKLTQEQIVEKNNTELSKYLNGGKVNFDPKDMDSDFFVTAQTGDASMAAVVLVGLGCVAVFAISRKKLAALSE